MQSETLPQSAPKQKRQRLTVEQKIARLDAQKQKLLAQQNKISRQLDTRRKVIVGAAVINAMEADAELTTRICALLNANVQRPLDREAVAPWLSPISTSR
jgi:hypothetical protein